MEGAALVLAGRIHVLLSDYDELYIA